MKQLICISFLSVYFSFFGPHFSFAQGPQFQKEKDIHSQWTITASKTEGIKKGDVITLTITVKPDKGWNLYSSNAKGEIAFLATSFSLAEESQGIELSGELKDGNDPHEEVDDIMGGIIRHFDEGQEVSYTQEIKIISTKFSLTGNINGQICFKDGMCVMMNGKIVWRGKFKHIKAESKTID